MKKQKETWTRFIDMHSGGGQKLKWAYIYIEAPQKEAEIIFYNRFHRNPNHVTCTCCGEDYSISPGSNLAQLTAFDRGCRCLETPRVNGLYKRPDDPAFDEHYYLEKDEAPPPPYRVSESSPLFKYQRLADFVRRKDICIIYAKDIKPNERNGELPEEGYTCAGGNNE